MRADPVSVLLAVVVLVAGAACGHTAPATTEHGAPKVQHPMGPNVHNRPPCTLLPDSRLTAAGLPANAQHRILYDAAADACQWGHPSLAGAAGLTIAWSHGTPSLDALYADRDEQAYFETTTVLGYPAVFANTIEREDGHCVLYVGLADTVAFYAAVQLDHPTRNEACAIARRAATEVVRTLQRK